MKFKKQTFFAVLAASILALVSAVAVHAMNENDQTGNNTNQPSVNNTGQQSSNDSKIPSDQNQGESNTHNSSSTSVTINGQKVDVPQNGSYDTTKDGVRVSGNNSQSSSSAGGSVSNNSSTSVNIQSH